MKSNDAQNFLLDGGITKRGVISQGSVVRRTFIKYINDPLAGTYTSSEPKILDADTVSFWSEWC